MIGKTLAHYEITGLLGEGGMGEVYKAQDTKLGREVALKVLPSEMAEDPERLERFRREARTLASVDHPNIVTIYSVEEVDEVHFVTMGLVEGKTLEELIPSSGLDLPRFFELAIPLAEAPRVEVLREYRENEPRARISFIQFNCRQSCGASTRRDDAGDSSRRLAWEPLASHSESATLGIGQAKRPTA